MTCIVGIVHEGKVHMGGDSAGVGRTDLMVRADRKVFKNGDFLLGFTSSFRMGQLLQHCLTPSKRHIDQDVYEYMVKHFVDDVRSCLKAGGYAKKTNEEEAGGTFLVGYAGRLFTIFDDYQVAENSVPYAAVGCGFELALGALHAMHKLDVTPEDKLLAALEAAATFSAAVCDPFFFESIG